MENEENTKEQIINKLKKWFYQFINTVIIVDDCPITRLMLQKILTMNNCNVIDTLDDGTNVLFKYKLLKPDIIIMDLNMPEQDGLTTIKEVMNFDPHAKIIVCSVDNMKEKIIKAVKLGAKDYILKPINTKDLIASVKKWFYQFMNTVIVVDDCPITRFMLQKILTMNNCNVIDTLDDGTNVLFKYKLLKPDCKI
jgi:two-component system chemotaxis response regulator CheY